MATFGIPYPKYHALDPSLPQIAASKAAPFLGSLALLSVLAIVGNAAASALHLAVPGTLIAALLLVLWLTRRPADAARLPAADVLVGALPLLFVPLIVGAVAPLRALGAALLPFALTTAAATLAALAATVAVARIAAWLSSPSR